MHLPQVVSVYADRAVDAAFRTALGLPPAAAAIANTSFAAASSVVTAVAIPDSVVIEYLKGLPSIKDVAVSISAEYWDWHGVPAPQLEYGGKLSSWFSKRAGSEVVYLEWEKGCDDAGNIQPGCDAALSFHTTSCPVPARHRPPSASQVHEEGGCQAECHAQAGPGISTRAVGRWLEDCTGAEGSRRRRSRPASCCCFACPCFLRNGPRCRIPGLPT